MKRLLYGFAAWSLLVALTGPAQAQYTYTTFDVPGTSDTEAFGINQAGQIVGANSNSSGVSHGFLRDVDSSYTRFDVPGARSTVALGINDASQIVGYYASSGVFHGFLLDVDGSYTTFDPPGATFTSAQGINDAGQIVGVYDDALGRPHSFLLD